MSKTTPTVLLIVTGALALASAPLSAGERIRPGQWEFTITHPGSEPNVFKHCVTADEATSVNGDTKTARAYAEKKAAGLPPKLTVPMILYPPTVGESAINTIGCPLGGI